MKSLKTSAKRAFTLVEIMIVVLIIGILLAIAVPNFIRAREQSRAKSCSANLKQIDAAKQQWAMDTKQDASAEPTAALLAGPTLYIKGVMPTCPSDSTIYTIGTVSADPSCNGGNNVAAYNAYHTLNGQP